jgi:hypothetical protein
MIGAICHSATLRERYLRSEEKAVQAQQVTIQAQERADRLLAKLQELGVDPADLE